MNVIINWLRTSVFTPARIATAIIVLTSLAAFISGLVGIFPTAWQNYALAATGLITKLVAILKFVHGNSKWEILVASVFQRERDRPLGIQTAGETPTSGSIEKYSRVPTMPLIAERMHPKRLGRSQPSPRKPTDFHMRDFVDVEKARAVLGAQPWPFALGQVLLSHYRSVWPMFVNDQLGNCVAAEAFHARQLWDACVGKPDAGFTDDQVIKFYEQSGYNPADPNTDQGWYLTACLAIMRKQGILLDGNADIVAWARVDHTNVNDVEVGHFLFGGLDFGAELPIDAQQQFETGQPWTPTTGPNGQPGSWGGHCMRRVDTLAGPFGQRACKVITWGTEHVVTQAWWDAYVDEVYATLPVDWELRVAYLARHNLIDFNKLEAMLSSVGQVAA